MSSIYGIYGVPPSAEAVARKSEADLARSAEIDAIVQDMLGRSATEEELEKYGGTMDYGGFRGVDRISDEGVRNRIKGTGEWWAGKGMTEALAITNEWLNNPENSGREFSATKSGDYIPLPEGVAVAEEYEDVTEMFGDLVPQGYRMYFDKGAETHGFLGSIVSEWDDWVPNEAKSFIGPTANLLIGGTHSRREAAEANLYVDADAYLRFGGMVESAIAAIVGIYVPGMQWLPVAVTATQGTANKTQGSRFEREMTWGDVAENTAWAAGSAIIGQNPVGQSVYAAAHTAFAGGGGEDIFFSALGSYIGSAFGGSGTWANVAASAAGASIQRYGETGGDTEAALLAGGSVLGGAIGRAGYGQYMGSSGTGQGQYLAGIAGSIAATYALSDDTDTRRTALLNAAANAAGKVMRGGSNKMSDLKFKDIPSDIMGLKGVNFRNPFTQGEWVADWVYNGNAVDRKWFNPRPEALYTGGSHIPVNVNLSTGLYEVNVPTGSSTDYVRKVTARVDEVNTDLKSRQVIGHGYAVDAALLGTLAHTYFADEATRAVAVRGNDGVYYTGSGITDAGGREYRLFDEESYVNAIPDLDKYVARKTAARQQIAQGKAYKRDRAYGVYSDRTTTGERVYDWFYKKAYPFLNRREGLTNDQIKQLVSADAW